jgi:Cell wall-active antibiotics response 4TMS YvqF
MTSPTPPADQPPVVAAGIAPVLVPAEAVSAEKGVMSFMSSLTVQGEWLMPRRFRVLCVMGNASIDLSEVRIAPGESDIEVRAIMGEVKIVVPHNLRVECHGHPVMGEFKVKRLPTSRPVPDAPLVRITGVAVMGSVSIKVIDPNEPTWLHRLRRRVLPSGE